MMPSKLNPLCKHLFLEILLSEENLRGNSPIDLFKYLLLSRSFLHISRLNALSHAGSTYRLKIMSDLCYYDLVEVAIANGADYRYSCGGFTTTEYISMPPDSFCKILSILNPPVVYVAPATFAPYGLKSFQNIFDDYQGKIYFISFNIEYYKMLVQLINKWNMSSIVSIHNLLIHEDIQPLELDYCYMDSNTEEVHLQHILSRHKIIHLRLKIISFKDRALEIIPHENVVAMKRLETTYVSYKNLDLFSNFLTENNFKLTHLSIKLPSKLHYYSDYNSMVNQISDTYRDFLEIREKVRTSTQKLHIKTGLELCLEKKLIFKQEWIEKLRHQCAWLKNVEFKTTCSGYRFVEMTLIVDEHLTLDLFLTLSGGA